jgi:hypothetical protein
MPQSMPIFDDELELYFRGQPHDSILDIGPGEGKYGQLLKRVQPGTRRIGVEIDPSYVEQYKLRDVYDDVLIMDAAKLMDDVRRKFGAVIIGDVIEHMRKSTGVDLLNFLAYRSQIIIVKFPVQMLQDDWHGHVSEAHVSVWNEVDFATFDHVHVERDLMRLVLIRGYLNRTIEWLPKPFIERLGWPSCTAYYDERPDRWKLADRETRWRTQTEAELRSILGAADPFILIDEDQTNLLAAEQSRKLPFVEKGGAYYGMPADDQHAIDELERLRARGAAFAVIAQPSFWALTYYPRFAAHLDQRYRKRMANDRVVVYELRTT